MYLIQRYGSLCAVDGVQEYVRISDFRRITLDNKSVEYMRLGKFQPTSAVKTGSIVVDGEDRYIVTATSKKINFIKCNLLKFNGTAVQKRYTETVDENNNVVYQWVDINVDVPVYAEIVTASLKQEDPGLLPTTKWVFMIPTSYVIQVMDRIVFRSITCQVDVIDDIFLPGIQRIQASDDTR